MRPPKLTRRSFLKTAAAGSAAAAVTVGLLSGCTHSGDEETSEPVVVDEDSAESILVQISAIKAAIHKVGELVILEDMKERLEAAGADDESKEQAATDIKRFSALIS